MKKITVFLLLGLVVGFCFQSSRCDNPQPNWSIVLGGDEYDAAQKILVVEDGYVVAVVTREGPMKAYLVKLNWSGQMQWRKVLPVEAPVEVNILSLQVDKQGNFLVLARTQSCSGRCNNPGSVYIKTDAAGNTLKQQAWYYTPNAEAPYALINDLFVTSGGLLFITGEVTVDHEKKVYLEGLSTAVVQHYDLGSDMEGAGMRLVERETGGLAILTQVNHGGIQNPSIIFVDGSGIQEGFSNFASDLGWGLDMIATSFGGFLITGFTQSSDVLKIYANDIGDLVSSGESGYPQLVDTGYSVVEDGDGYTIVGESGTGKGDALFYRLDLQASIQESYDFGSPDSRDYALDHKVTAEGWVVVGVFNNDAWIFTVSKDIQAPAAPTKIAW